MYTTVNGVLRVRRTVRRTKGEPAIVLGDDLLEAAGEVISVGVRELVCRLGECCGGFRAAAGHLERLAGVKLSHETMRTIVEGEGRAVVPFAPA